MHDPIDRPLEIITWGYRLLWVLLFISLIVVMGYWHTIITYTFLAAVLALLLPVLFSREVFFGEDDNLEDDVHKCTLEHRSEY